MARDEIRIKQATSDDLATIADMWSESAIYHARIEPRFQYASDLVRPIESFFSKMLESETGYILVALDGKEIVGYISSFIQERAPIHAVRKIGFVDGLFVKPHVRRQGIGRQLWHTLLEWLEEHDIPKIQLTVASKNPVAMKFWQRMGFTDIMYRLEFNS